MANGPLGSAIEKAQSTAILNTIDESFPLGSFLSTRNTNPSNAPKAYINIVFMDEQFKFVAQNMINPDVSSNFSRVKADKAGLLDASLVLSQKAPKDGWAFVFLSNESDETVSFDNLTIVHDHSRISEETHYYPFGLKMAGISSRAAGKLTNSYGFQGSFAEHEDETGYDEFSLRMYDPQIGRWTGVDPFDEFASGYVGMGNDPINHTDPTGGYISVGAAGAIGGALVGGFLGHNIAKRNGAGNGSAIAYGMAGAFVGAGIGYGIFESLTLGSIGTYGKTMTNKSRHLWDNLKAFYAGMFGTEDQIASHWGFENIQAIAPNFWGGKSKTVLEIESLVQENTRTFLVRRRKIDLPTDRPPIIPTPAVSINLCPCLRAVNVATPNQNIPFNFATEPNVISDLSYTDPRISNEQFNAVRFLVSRVQALMRPGDIAQGITLTHTMNFVNNPPGFIPSTGSFSVAFDPITRRRTDTWTANSVLASGQGINNTVAQNYASQTRRLAGLIGGMLNIQNVTGINVWGPSNGARYRIRGRILRPGGVNLQYQCSCQAPAPPPPRQNN